jgi:apolipoprotein N-acyltransferase
MGRPDEDLLPDNLNRPKRQQFGGFHFQVGILALCLSFATIPSFLIPQFPLLVSDINVSTPLTVGCVLPSFQRYKHHVLTLDDFIEESKKIQSLARVILWPEGAVVFNNASERDEGLQLVRENFKGVYTGVSFEETIDDPRDLTGRTSIRRTGIAIVSKDSEPQIYYKRHLVPFAESFSLDHSSTPPSIFEMELVNPKDVKKIDWAPEPHTRTIPLTSSICLDFAFPSQFAGLTSRPALILAPARTWERTVGHAMWLQARQRAAELQSIVLWCDGGEGGVSGVAGRGFNDVVQVGSGSFVRTIGIRYPFNDRKTFFARFGDSILILFWIFVFIPSGIDFSASTLVNVHLASRAKYFWRTIRARQNPTEPPNLLD